MEDKKRILKMVEEGKITAEEALKLLQALESDVKPEKITINNDEFFNIQSNDKAGKMIYIRVKDSSGSKVRVNVPIDFIKIMGGIDRVCNGKLDKYNLEMDKIIEAIDNGYVGRLVEVDTEEGDKVIIEIA